MNRFLKNIIVFVASCFCPIILLAQSTNLKSKLVIPADCILVKDSLTIIPSSVEIILQNDTVTNYTIDNSIIKLDSLGCENFKNVQLEITYRTFDFDILKAKFLIDTSQLIKKERIVYIGYDLDPYVKAKDNSIISEKDLNYSGSCSRGFSVGNAQSLVLNYSFD